MASQLHIYFGNVTAGMRDGTEASSGTELSPISVTLDASQSEAKAVKCAVRCDTGYYIEGNTTITKIGTNAAKWKVAVSPMPHGWTPSPLPMWTATMSFFG